MPGSKPAPTFTSYRPWRLLGWSLMAALALSIFGVGDIVERALRVTRNSLYPLHASGQFVVIGIDDKSVRELGRWPWRRQVHADLIGKAMAAGAKRVAFDILFSEKGTPQEDAALATALGNAPGTTIAFQSKLVAQGETKREVFPLPMFRQRAIIADIVAGYNYGDEVERLARGSLHDGRIYPEFATALAQTPASTDQFRVNYAFDPHRVKRYSATDLVHGRIPPALLRGKTLVVALDSDRLGDQINFPGYGRMPAALVHIVGAETLMHGATTDLGWISALVVALAICWAALWHAKSRNRFACLVVGAVILLALPFPLERRNIMIDVVPALLLLAAVAIGLARNHAALRALTNDLTGLPNLDALKSARDERGRPLIVARVYNYAEIASTLDQAGERTLVEQVVQRLGVGAQRPRIYHSDSGVFAWSVDPGTALGHHAEALHSLFRNPVKVDGAPFDIAIAFGVEMGSARSIANRLGSALVAADEAAAESLKWKYHDPERLKDASWKLSLLSQLDAAIDNGEVWVAYQPQMDLRTGRIRGAEALARWTHSEKGPISPTEFIATAEQYDRIEKLSFFVLDQAIAAAADINRRLDDPFVIAVNMSAKLLGHRHFVSEVKSTLKRHGLKPHLLTLELTETAALSENGDEIQLLERLRDLGITLSLDDYGTGLSTLNYLKTVPAEEIKIDQIFVRGMRDQRSDLVMVQSTIGLAHSLGRTVVAEGVESLETLELLKSLDCDMAQGFIIGRPASIDQLSKRLLQAKGVRAA